MTLTEIVDRIVSEYGNRFQITPLAAISLVDVAQKRALAKDIPAFLRQAKLTISSGSRGPYSLPSDCRSAVRVLEVDLGGIPSLDGFDAVDAVFDQVVGRTASLVDVPSDDCDYWLEYWFRPSTISSLSDNAKVVIPEEWHHAVLVCGAAILADQENYGGADTDIALEKIFQPFWYTMESVTDGRARPCSSGSW